MRQPRRGRCRDRGVTQSDPQGGRSRIVECSAETLKERQSEKPSEEDPESVRAAA
jgi:hypothetical protein